MITALAYLTLTQQSKTTINKPKPVKLAPAVFADDSTRRIVNLSKSAFSKLKSAKFTIKANGESKKYVFSSGKVAGTQRGAQWSWAAKRLLLLCNKGFFRGNMGPYNVNAWLTKVGGDPEVLPIQLAAKKSPFDALIPPGSRVRKAGTMALNGVAVDVIEVKSARLRVTMTIRQDNRLITDMSASNVDKDGNVLFSSTRSISWSDVNKPISSKEFAVAAGKTPKSIKVYK